MRFARLGPRGAEIPVLAHGERFYDLRPLTSDIDGAFLADRPVERVCAAVSDGVLPELDGANRRRGAAIARPSAVICIGLNYSGHAAESGVVPPEQPLIFLKTPNTVSGPDDDVVIPRGSTKTDWEVELGIVIGTRAAYLDTDKQAAQHIAGYVTVNDISERAFQLEGSGDQWSKGKCAPGFTPTGPYLVTPDEVDVTNVRLSSYINGEPRQDSTTRDAILEPPAIIRYLSQYMTLEPGDLVLTGTPEGVGLSGRFPYIRPGDVAEIEVEGLGKQRHRFIPWSPAT